MKEKKPARSFPAVYGGGMTHAEIAREMGISRARVWQIEQRALSKLRRHPVALAKLRDLADLQREHINRRIPSEAA